MPTLISTSQLISEFTYLSEHSCSSINTRGFHRKIFKTSPICCSRKDFSVCYTITFTHKHRFPNLLPRQYHKGCDHTVEICTSFLPSASNPLTFQTPPNKWQHWPDSWVACYLRWTWPPVNEDGGKAVRR